MTTWRGASYRVFPRADGVLLCAEGGGADWLVTGYFFESEVRGGALVLPEFFMRNVRVTP